VSSQPPESAPTEPLSFEQALAELEANVHDLEEGDLGLDAALARYEQGVKRLRQCQELLEKAERRIELLLGADAAGNPVCQPLDDTALTLDEKAQGRSRRRSDSGTPGSARSRGPKAGGTDIDEYGRTS
jgi:exodeoxyribonuclease VII small subunit